MIDYHVVAASAFLNSSVTFGALHQGGREGGGRLRKKGREEERERERGKWGKTRLTQYTHIFSVSCDVICCFRIVFTLD